MPVPQPAPDYALLPYLTALCYVLAVAGVLIWVSVFVVRLVRLRFADREAAAENELTEQVLEQMSGGNGMETLLRLRGWKRRLLLDILRTLINETKGRDRILLIEMLRAAGFQSGAFEDLRHGYPARRQVACELLGYFDDEPSVEVLRNALRDRDVSVRLTAALALLRMGRIESLRDLLIGLNLSADDPPLILAEMLGRLPSPLHGEAIELVRDEGLPMEWRRLIAIALSRLQVHNAFEVIAGLRRSDAPRLRAAAWVALGELGDPRAGEILKEGLDDPVADVRRAACECAARSGGPELLPDLSRLLTDPDWWVRYHAAEAMWALGGEGRRILADHNQTVPDEDPARQAILHIAREAPHGSS